MVTFRVGDTVTLCVAFKPFCGSTVQAYTVNEIDCAIGSCPVSPVPSSWWTCLTPSGVSTTFQWTNSTDNTCSSTNNLELLGIATTDSSGIATLQYTITQNDLDIYNIAIADPDYYGRFDLRVCYNNGGTENVIKSNIRGKTDNIIILPVLQATHYAQIPIAFLSDEVATLLENNISEISNRFTTEVGNLPTPWTYLYSSFDRNSSSVLIYLNNANVPLSVSKYDIVADISGVLDWLWDNLFGIFSLAVTVLAGTAMLIGGVSLLPLIAAILGIVGTGVWIYDAVIKKQELGKAVDNLNVVNQQATIPSDLKQFIIDLWNNSDKSRDSCLNYRLISYRDLHIEYIKSYILKFPQQIAMVSELNSEINSFKPISDNIISTFSNQQYSITICDTYYISLDNEITSSTTRVLAIVAKYITGGVWEYNCSDYVTTGLCKQAGCMWSYDKCVSKQSCIIPNPLDGTCIYSTENMIAGTPYLVGIGLVGALAFTVTPSIINILSGGLNEWNKTLNTKQTETINAGIDINKPTYTKSKPKKK